jgi:hypothetical protein
VTVSIYQLVRCTVLIITAVLKHVVLKDRLAFHMWLGVSINLTAMMLVSATTFFDTENSGASTPTPTPACPHTAVRIG